jgi:glyceraldehyde-3-phosphate dehydrogenase/erythrose-4-phosphate dehydrogenase
MRICAALPPLEIVAVNDVTDAATLAALLAHDSVVGDLVLHSARPVRGFSSTARDERNTGRTRRSSS